MMKELNLRPPLYERVALPTELNILSSDWGTRTPNFSVTGRYDSHFTTIAVYLVTYLDKMAVQVTKLEPQVGFEPTSSLLQVRSITNYATEAFERIPRFELGFPTWKAGVLAIRRYTHVQKKPC